jgi:hypothetical protein
MNYADIENTWHSSHNRPSPAELEKQKMKFTDTLHRRGRNQVIILAITAVYVIQVTGFVLSRLLADDPQDLLRLGVAVLFCALMLATPVHLINQYRKYLAGKPASGGSIKDNLGLLLAQNRRSQASARLVMFLQPLAALMLAVIIVRSLVDGNSGPGETTKALVIFATGQVLAVSCVAWSYFFTLRPEHRRLGALFTSYE